MSRRDCEHKIFTVLADTQIIEWGFDHSDGAIGAPPMKNGDSRLHISFSTE